MSAGEIKCLGRGDAGDQAIRDIGCSNQSGRVLGALEDEIAMNLVGDQRQIMLGAQ